MTVTADAGTTDAGARPGGVDFPFSVSPQGGISMVPDEDAALRAKVVQVLFTAPGERVNLPEFGCGLLTMVFDAANPVLAAATEFTVGQALTRWLGDELVVSAVDVRAEGETMSVEVAYVRRVEMAQRSVRVRFS